MTLSGNNVTGTAAVAPKFKPAQLPLIRKRIGTPDGDFLDLDFLEANGRSVRNEPTIVILHGLEGSSKAPYVLSLLGEIKKLGRRACAVNMQMCSGEPNRLPATYHSGKSEDLDCVIRYLKEKENDSQESSLWISGYKVCTLKKPFNSQELLPLESPF